MLSPRQRLEYRFLAKCPQSCWILDLPQASKLRCEVVLTRTYRLNGEPATRPFVLLYTDSADPS